jgi:MmgE/PrpD N-terminal domain
MPIERRAPLRFPRRHFLKGIVATGFTTGLPAFPVIAQNEGGPPMLAETLARYAAGLKYEDIPEDVVRLAKRTIPDTIGCTFGGYDAGPSKVAWQSIRAQVFALSPSEVGAFRSGPASVRCRDGSGQFFSNKRVEVPSFAFLPIFCLA